MSRQGGVSVNTDHYRRCWDEARERALRERSEVTLEQRRKLAEGIRQWREMFEAAYVRSHPPTAASETSDGDVVWGLLATGSRRG